MIDLFIYNFSRSKDERLTGDLVEDLFFDDSLLSLILFELSFWIWSEVIEMDSDLNEEELDSSFLPPAYYP